MATVHSEPYRNSGNTHETGPRTSSSSIPLLDDGVSASKPAPSQTVGDTDHEAPAGTGKTAKRKFWNLGRKKNGDGHSGAELNTSGTSASPAAAPPASIATMRPVSPLPSSEITRTSASPPRTWNPYGAPTSPVRNVLSSSPRLHSPASSQIFERSVQEEVPAQASPAIPSHIITENHIPPVLEASSAAITDDGLDPDTVEIITHAAHQPAAVTVTGTCSESTTSMSAFYPDDLNAHSDLAEDSASNYGALDTNDVRRLSFISFADVVHAEHVLDSEHHPHPSHLPTRGSVQNLTGLSTSAGIAPPRSPSPVRSPVSSDGALGTSPPTSVSAPSFKGVETSPSRGARGAPGSPLHLPAHSPPLGGELNIETMSQALRRTGSGDLSGARSQPMSAIGDGDGEIGFERSFR